jgi:hypothetical protein
MTGTSTIGEIGLTHLTDGRAIVFPDWRAILIDRTG